MDQPQNRHGTKLQDLPMDLASEIFGHLGSSSDLLHVAQSSKALFRIAIRLLYRNIHYDTLKNFTENALFWHNREDNVFESPRVVSIGPGFGQKLARDSRWNDVPVGNAPAFAPQLNVWTDPQLLPLDPQFPRLRTRLVSFTNLHTLSFEKAVLPLDLYEFLPELVNLRSLCLRDCTLHCAATEPELVPFMATRPLPVSELTLLNNRIIFPGSLINNPVSTTPSLVYRSPYYLIRQSPQLRALCIDWTIYTARRFSEDDDLPTPAFANLDYLELKLPAVSETGWNANDFREDTRTLLKTTLHLVLSSCHRLTELVLLGYIPGIRSSGHPSTSAVVLPALQRFTGHVAFLKSTLRHCAHLETVILSNEIKDVSSAMQAFPHSASRISYLDIMVAEWHVEIMHAVTFELPGLRELRIRYGRGFPDEDKLISFGPEFFARLTKISVFHCYQHQLLCVPNDAPRLWMARARSRFIRRSVLPALQKLVDSRTIPDLGPSASPDADGLLAVWRKFAPELREVRLVEQYAWRRAYVGDTWCKRDLGSSENKGLLDERVLYS